MRYMLAILLNGIAQLEYDRNVPLKREQADYLDRMDEKMDKGFQLGEQLIETPDLEQKAEFVTSSLYQAIKSNNEVVASAMTSYLAVKIPALKQVKIEDKDGNVKIELIYDKIYTGQQAVQFDPNATH